MKKELLAVVLLASCASSALAQNTSEKQTSCFSKGVVFMMAAEDRDIGRSPQESYKIIGGGFLYKGSTPVQGINKEFIKQSINTVYFDPGFANARGQLLRNQIFNLCLNDGKPLHQPLK